MKRKILEERREEILKVIAEMHRYEAGNALAKVNRRLKMAEVSWIRTFQRVAAIIVLPLLLGTVGFFVEMKKESSCAETAWHTVETIPGQKSVLDLPDGTKVWLNSESSISYPLNFDKKNRKVRLSGEAFFDVTRNESKPFFVDMGGMEVKVLGTEFNIINYKDESTSQVFLESGRIQLIERIEDKEKVLYTMKPGDRAVYNSLKEELLIGKGHTDVCMAWMEGKLVFREESMQTVIKRLSRWFNVEIEIRDAEIAAYTYTATFQHESIEQILDLLKLSAPIAYKIEQRERDENNVFTKDRVVLYAPK